MNSSELVFVEASDAQWDEYGVLARRAYGQPVDDIARLGAYADRRVVLRGGTVVAGGLGLLIPQWFGGRPVPSASMACGCVAPEERGGQLAARLIVERLRPLREQGAVLATLWTSSTGYVRRMGWEAPAAVSSWTVPTGELRRRTEEPDVEIQPGDTSELGALQDALAARWNGTWQRPAWWDAWQQAQHPHLNTYRFSPAGQEPTGVLSVAGERHPVDGRRLVVHDFWAADHTTAAAMLAFLGRHDSRIPTVEFQRTGVPPGPLLLHAMHRSGAASAHSWHPWMLRVLDLRRAVQARGWHQEVTVDLPLGVVAEDGQQVEHYILHIAQGIGELTPVSTTADLVLTRGQFAVWYAGGYRTATAAALAGVDGAPASIARLVTATNDQEPWLADYF